MIRPFGFGGSPVADQWSIAAARLLIRVLGDVDDLPASVSGSPAVRPGRFGDQPGGAVLVLSGSPEVAPQAVSVWWRNRTVRNSRCETGHSRTLSARLVPGRGETMASSCGWMLARAGVAALGIFGVAGLAAGSGVAGAAAAEAPLHGSRASAHFNVGATHSPQLLRQLAGHGTAA